MDIEGLGQKQIERFLQEGFLSDVPSIYRLAEKREQLAALDRAGEKSVDNLLKAIEGSKTRPLDRFVFALGIRFVGERTARDLAAEFGSIEMIREANYERLIAIPDIGPRTASEIEQWIEEPENQALLDALLAAGVQPEPVEKALGGPYEGQTVVFTGKLERLTRDGAEALITKLGGKAAGSVSKLTNLVVAGPGAGSKLARAEQLGVKVMTEDEFLATVPEELL